MKKLYAALLAALEKGEDVVLCSILASSGSSPRGEGAKMLVFEDKSTLGTIGGGAVELQATRQAHDVFGTRSSYLHSFCLAPNQVEDIGMICGGNVTVYYQLFEHGDAEALAVLRRIYSLIDSNTNAWILNELSDGAIVRTGVYDEEQGLCFPGDLAKDTLSSLLKPRSVYTKSDPGWYAEPIARRGRVYIFGGGHVGKALVPVLSKVDFSVVVYDNRKALARPEVHPEAVEVIFGDFCNIAEHVSLTKDDYVVIMTPGHQADFEVLLQALRTPATYVGCIGSSHKVAAVRARLMEAGISEADCDRTHMPIGLPIGGETPEEIAISVAGELIRHRAAHA